MEIQFDKKKQILPKVGEIVTHQNYFERIFLVAYVDSNEMTLQEIYGKSQTISPEKDEFEFINIFSGVITI